MHTQIYGSRNALKLNEALKKLLHSSLLVQIADGHLHQICIYSTNFN